jgi:hypothetical protein
MRRPAAIVAVLAVLVAPRAARAHATATVSVELTETKPGHALLRLRPSPELVALGLRDRVRVRLEPPCTARPADAEGFAGDPVQLVECPGAIGGARIVAEGLGPLVGEAILVATLDGGRRVSRVLTTDEPAFTLPETQGGLALARAYVRHGFTHITLGYDHLLFLVALVLLLRRPRAVLLAETAFTLSHSVTFSATALGLLHVPPALAEALIALSLILLALDVGRVDGVGQSITSDMRGASLALVFGLVHGLGFAGGLSEVGLPDHDVAAALLGFAGGLEAGQVAFLALLLAAHHVAGRALPDLLRRRVEPAIALGIGGLSTCWFIQRAALCLAH